MQTEQVQIRGKVFDVGYTLHPEEKEVTHYPDGSGYPGMGASVDIESISYNGEDFLEFMHEQDVAQIEMELLK